MTANRERKLELVLFDVGGVLVSLRPLSEALVSAMGCGETGVAPWKLEEAVRQFRNGDALAAYETGRLSTPEFCAAVREAFDLDLDDRRIEAVYRAMLGPAVEGMEEVVREVRRQGLRACGLSDTSPIHLAQLPRYPAVAALERLVTSCETGWRKPEPRAYLRALEILEAPAEVTLFIDDRPENVEGARQAGLDAVGFESAASLRALLPLGASRT